MEVRCLMAAIRRSFPITINGNALGDDFVEQQTSAAESGALNRIPKLHKDSPT